MILRSPEMFQMLSTKDLREGAYRRHVARAHEINPGQTPRGILIATNPYSGKRLWMDIRGPKRRADAPVAVWGPSRKTPERYASLEAYIRHLHQDLDERFSGLAHLAAAQDEAKAARKLPSVSPQEAAIRRALRPLVDGDWWDDTVLDELTGLGVPARVAKPAVWLLELMEFVAGDAGSERLGPGQKHFVAAISLVKKSKALPHLAAWLGEIRQLRSCSAIDDELDAVAEVYGATGLVRPLARLMAESVR